MSAPAGQDEFVEYLREHRRLVYRVAAAYAPAAGEREDLAQEIIAQLWKAFPAFDRTRRFCTWMYRIALNVALSHVRRENRRGVHEPLDASAEKLADERTPAPDAGDRLALAQRLIAGLSELDRALLLMHLDDHSHREIADVLGISESNVSTKLHRLKQRLRRDAAE